MVLVEIPMRAEMPVRRAARILVAARQAIVHAVLTGHPAADRPGWIERACLPDDEVIARDQPPTVLDKENKLATISVVAGFGFCGANGSLFLHHPVRKMKKESVVSSSTPTSSNSWVMFVGSAIECVSGAPATR
jgi:hypothetical protein